MAGGSNRCTSLFPATYDVRAVEYRSRRCSSCTFFLSQTFHAFFSHSIAPLTYTSLRGGGVVLAASAVARAAWSRSSSSYAARSYPSIRGCTLDEDAAAAAAAPSRARSFCARTSGYGRIGASRTHRVRVHRSKNASYTSEGRETRAMIARGAQRLATLSLRRSTGVSAGPSPHHRPRLATVNFLLWLVRLQLFARSASSVAREVFAERSRWRMQTLWRLWHLSFYLHHIAYSFSRWRYWMVRARCLARRTALLRRCERSRRDCRAADTIVAGCSVVLRCG